ncbi:MULTISPECIES: cbb3-type cytochrome c oxidase N-terminal domain-containing protein [Sphingobacterium]|uniref:Cbb3-type cytochrome c oxidase N-terminal domain-containing protein n=2 Tax=Sphingobacterium TaxID=28453 RepID=A0ABW5KY48_9SPHI|nr:MULTISPECIES: cbb3-type cytochrome c oxidase N-terminal domain-containing protein [Sphingobacterium]
MSLFLMAAEPVEGVTQWKFGAVDLYSDILIVALIVVMITLLFSALVVHKAMKSILRVTMPELVREEEAQKRLAKAHGKGKWGRIWNNLLELRPIDEEKDMVIDHEYDGIQELNNPIPTWFNVLFYSTVVFGFAYLLVYHVFGWGLNQDQEYAQELAVAEKAKQEYLAQAANLIDEGSVQFDPAMAPAGKAIFTANCVACHGAAGEGGIGPNLADRFWIHGGEIKDVFKTVKYGVPEKGMVPWEQTLTPGQIAEVSSYILTLRDTNPANAKAPEGVEVKAYESEGASADAEETPADSTVNK